MEATGSPVVRGYPGPDEGSLFYKSRLFEKEFPCDFFWAFYFVTPSFPAPCFLSLSTHILSMPP